MEFEQLEDLQRRLRELKRLQSKSLSQYFTDASPSRQGVGFRHLWHEKTPADLKKEAYSHASTATCIVSLVSTGAWWHEKELVAADHPWIDYTSTILAELCNKMPHSWDSAGLGPGNPFTVAFTLEGIKALAEKHALLKLKPKLRTKVSNTIARAESLLLKTLDKGSGAPGKPNHFSERGAANVNHYPPTSFLTQLVVRALGGAKLKKKTKLKKQVEQWCGRQIEHELALLGSESNVADPLALAYAVTAFLALADAGNLSPINTTLVKKAVDYIFDAQLKDGLWPRSKPLHHYPAFGNAYCYEYETFAHLLQCTYLETQLIGKLDKLEQCIQVLDRTANSLPNGGKAWPSGHHPHVHGAESWSTASVYQFAHHLDRLVAEAIRKDTFKYVGSIYTKPNEHANGITVASPFRPQDLLDSTFRCGGRQTSLRATVQDNFLRPILRDIYQVVRGESLSKETNISAILFGPPGTSKTQLAKQIAAHLGWPRLDIDPSHLFKGGLEQLQSESNRLFNMLAALERTVVFFDEFDEMVRERTSERADLMSRFLTTAMLPKLSRIAEERKIVFLLATNHIEDFDFAISRLGRFDMLIPVMPPSLRSKLKVRKWNGLSAKVRPILNQRLPDGNGSARLTYRKILEALTFAEYKALNEAAKGLSSPTKLKQCISEAWQKATLSKPVHTNVPGDADLRLLDFYKEQCEKITRLGTQVSV